MKLIRIAAIILSGGILLNLPLLSVRAEEYGASSDISVSFVENTEVTPPVNPEDPSLPGGGGGTGMAGPLSIDYVSSLDFGDSLAVSGQAKVYNTTVAIPYIQVTDLRGTGAGWSVSAVCSTFSQGESVTLPGAEIVLTNASVLSVNPDLAPPIPKDPVVLKTDGATVSRIIDAAADTGRGTWVNRWYTQGQGENVNVQLKVPAGSASVGGHNAVITWTLTDAPV